MVVPWTRLSRLAPSEDSLVGYLFWLSRPRFWLYLAGPLLVGLVYAAAEVAAIASPLTAALFAYFLVPANIYLYGVNDIFDADVDEENPKKAQEGKEIRYTGSTTVIVAVLVSILLGLALLPFLTSTARIGLIGFVLLAGAYSVPPVRFKTTPFLDSLSNGLYVLPGVVGYAAIADGFPPLFAIAGGWVWAMGMHTFSAIPDIEPDRVAGIQTTATFLGERRTLAYCAASWLLAQALFGLVHPMFAGLLAVYPLFVATIIGFDIDIGRAYWWFPIINTLVGMSMTIGGFWVIIYG